LEAVERWDKILAQMVRRVTIRFLVQSHQLAVDLVRVTVHFRLQQQMVVMVVQAVVVLHGVAEVAVQVAVLEQLIRVLLAVVQARPRVAVITIQVQVLVLVRLELLELETLGVMVMAPQVV
jgi:hypothetical protein